ncbi:MAG: citrate synthase [Spirochaetaceae bacterium]|jgi:citrate synthase|nr:citrate synthase [Spirochaetaceae bacterium]
MIDKQDEILRGYITELGADIRSHYTIDPEEFAHYTIKRGLRNSDGTGVFAGVTRIGSVQGYMVSDGEPAPMEGKLYYRGIDLMDIVQAHRSAGTFGYEEVAYLLLFGELPTQRQLELYNRMLSAARKLPEGFTEDAILSLPGADIMNKLTRCILTLYSFDSRSDDTSVENVIRQSIELIGRVPVIIANAYAAKRHYFDGESLFIHVPQESLSLAENFLHILRKDNRYTQAEARLLDFMLIIHAEHGGGNNSAFACRTLSSTGTDTYAALSAAIGSLKGPLHGGANMKVMEMFTHIREQVSDMRDADAVYAYLERILNKEVFDRSGKLYGLGHAVYTKSDPRTVLLKQFVHSLVEETASFPAEGRGVGNQPLTALGEDFALMQIIEEQGIRALQKRLHNRKVICANVDMYSGLVYRTLGIPEELFTPIFAAARMAGWCAHRMEELISGERIIRPAYRAVTQRTPYVSLHLR